MLEAAGVAGDLAPRVELENVPHVAVRQDRTERRSGNRLAASRGRSFKWNLFGISLSDSSEQNVAPTRIVPLMNLSFANDYAMPPVELVATSQEYRSHTIDANSWREAKAPAAVAHVIEKMR